MNRSQTQIYLICGSGGVGKTTVSAALGLALAESGKNVIVLTIDPAKRLADSLGIGTLSDEPTRIKTGTTDQRGQLWAMMLDTKRTFDRLIEKFSPSEGARNKILNNKLYQYMSKMLAGTQEYMAMERLYEIYSGNGYDAIILDTPPMQNALDFLTAPQKMIGAIQNSMLHLLLKPTFSLGKTGLKFLQKGSQKILKVFDRITGFAFLQDVSEMLIAFKELLGGFEYRAGQVNELLKQRQTVFTVVCSTQDNSIRELELFQNKLASDQCRLSHVIVNRVYGGGIEKKHPTTAVKKELANYFSKKEAEVLVRNFNHYFPLMAKDRLQLKRIEALVGKSCVLTVPLFLSDVHDLAGLGRVAQRLKPMIGKTGFT